MAPQSTEKTISVNDQHYLGQPFEHWLRMFRQTDRQDRDRYHAVDALAGFGEKAIPALVKALEFENYQWSATRALARMGQPAFSTWLSLTQSSNPIHRKVGVRLLKELWHEKPSLARKLLCDALEDEDADVRREAGSVFHRLAQPLTPGPIMALAKALKDGNAQVRFWAVQALRYIDAGDEEGTDALLEALHDSDIAVRLAAAESLESIKPKSTKVYDALKDALNDPIDTVRVAVHRLLKTIQADRVNQVQPDPIVVTDMETIQKG